MNKNFKDRDCFGSLSFFSCFYFCRIVKKLKFFNKSTNHSATGLNTLYKTYPKPYKA